MIRLIKPYISFDEISQELEEIFDSGILTKGKYSKLFPQLIQEYTGARHAFLATSATTALSMALKLLDIGPGDEVAVSDFSFPASANVIEDVGARSVFVDVSLDTYNMEPDKLLTKISAATKAVIFVDALGNPSGLDTIARICKERGIPLIEDAACAIGSSINGHKVGSIADITCFSLHPRKLLTCGEGGIITTDNDQYATTLSYKLNHGADASGNYISYGYNYRLPEIASLMGCSQIKKIDAIVSTRRTQAAEYAQLLEPLGFKPQSSAPNAYHNFQSVVFTVPAGCSRDLLVKYLAQQEIESTIGTYCLSEQTYFLDRYHDVQPNASFLQHNTITLPCYDTVPVKEVCDAVRAFMLQQS
jgi:dTDP-4-amino-4,6-dideoxygalactose transaminase